MADDDEIDILGDFSFNSCFAQNNQGIPSCSNREDTVHPQWLLDSTATNWYDIQSKKLNRARDSHMKRIPRESTSAPMENINIDIFAMWNKTERDLLAKEMAKYGRNIRKISETIKTKTEAEIQALIEAEYGVNLDTPIFGLEKHEDHDDVPAVVQEEIVTDDTFTVTSALTRKPFRKKTYNKSKNSLLKPSILDTGNKNNLVDVNPSEIFYEEDLIIGSTESIGSDLDSTDIVSKNIGKFHKGRVGKKIGNHRRKVSRNYDKSGPRNRSKDLLLKSPQRRQRKDSSLSEDSTKSPKMQIVLGSGQALPVSEGEQVIKIEKKNDSEPDSDIDIDVDSDKEENVMKSPQDEAPSKLVIDEAPIAVPLRKFEPMRKRRQKINLDGGGGCTIMHTASGDLYEIAAEPRRERAPRKVPVQLIHCRVYNAEKPAPYAVRLHVSALVSMDAHAHTSRHEVMGLVGGRLAAGLLTLAAYRPAAAAAGRTHCEMDPVSQARAAEALQRRGWAAAAWHHSHPSFAAAPSARDLRTQRALQRALERPRAPLLALVTAPHWPPGRAASQYRCIRVEEEEGSEEGVGYQFSVKLVPDLTAEGLDDFLCELSTVLRPAEPQDDVVDMVRDICPQAKISYLDKLISSISHHMRSAGYADDDPVTRRLLQGVRDVFR